MEEKTYTTSEVARKVGVSYQTLHNWLNSNLVPSPKLVNVGKNSVYLWTEADIERARKIKGTLRPGRKPKK
jgi:DNA-binding transcriptional MerR regulator